MKLKGIVATIIVLLSIIQSYFVYGTNLSELKDKKEELQEQIESTNAEAEQVNIELTELLEQIYELEAKISNYETQIAELDLNLTDVQKEVSATTKELEIIQTDYDKQKKALESRLVALYEAGQTTYLDVLLNSNSLSDFISNYFLISEITSYDNDLLDNIERQKNRIVTIKEELENKEENLKTIKKEKEKTAIALSNAKLVKDIYAQKLSAEEIALKAKIDELEGELDEVESEMLYLATGSLGENYVGGVLAWPVPSSTIITSPFGMRFHPILKINRMHNGIDIGAPTGKDIIATNDGVVIKAGYVGSYGNLVMIDHGGGVVTAYGHGSEILVETGQTVSRGEAVMLIGSTGLSTGPHLHFEVRINGTCVDPLPYITSNKEVTEEQEEN